MTALRTALAEREEEFHVHLKLAQALDRRLVESDEITIGEIPLTVRHLMTMKSGLIVHLYNIVEAVMTRTMEEVGAAVIEASPADWTNSTLKEWLRLYAATSTDGNEEKRLEVVHKAALKLLSKEPIESLKFKKPSGTWSDKIIYQFSRRLEVEFRLTSELAPKMQSSFKYGEKTPLEFLADRRNAIAHGRRSFERGADDLTLDDIEELAEVTLSYMALAADAFQAFVNDKRFIAAVP